MQLYRDVVSSVIESAILAIDPKLLHKTENQLKKQNLTFNDSLERPEHIFEILQDTCGDDCNDIIKLINTKMNNVGTSAKFDDFLYVFKKTIKPY